MLQPGFVVQRIVPIILLLVVLVLVPAAVAKLAHPTAPADRTMPTVSGPRVHHDSVARAGSSLRLRALGSGAPRCPGAQRRTRRACCTRPGPRSQSQAFGSTTPWCTRGPTQHYEYVFPDGSMSVYDIDHGHKLVERVSLPTTAGVRGVAASPMTHMLYISYGGDGGSHGTGSLLEYNLLTGQVVWTKTYRHGIDSMAISPDGKTIYMPDGELSPNGRWYVVNAATGHDVGTINAGTGPHNTVVSLGGSLVYLGGRNYNYFEVASTKTNQVIRKVGPFKSGIRPFTVNGKNTLVYTSVTGFLGFQVGDITRGKVLYTVPIKGFSVPSNFPASDPSHGISLSPDERELYVMDSPNSYVHVFDVSGVPRRPPDQVANIPMSHPMPGYEHPCAYDCFKDGWLQHSRDGRFVYVGDEGDVIDTARRRVVATLPALAKTRKMLEIDWRNGVPVFTTTRTGLGHITNQVRPTSR